MSISVVQSSVTGNLSGSGTFTTGLTQGNWVLMGTADYIFTANGGFSCPILPTLGGVTPTGTILLASNTNLNGDSTATAAYLIPVTSAVAGATAWGFTNGSQASGSGGGTAIEISGLGTSPTLDQSSTAFGLSGTIDSGTAGPISSQELVFGLGCAFGAAVTISGTWDNTAGPPDAYTNAAWKVASSGTQDFAATCNNVNWSALVVTVRPTSASQPALIQVAAGSATASSVTVTLSSPTTRGNCLVALIGNSANSVNGTPSGITLGGSADNWAQVASQGNGSDHALTAGWVDPNCAGGQTSVVVSTTGGSGDILFAWVFEFSRLSGILDVSSGGANGFSSTWTSGTTGSTSQASEVAFGITAGASSGTPVLTSLSSPWTNEVQQTLAGSQHVKAAICGYQILSSTGAQTYAGTANPTNTNDTLVFTLKASSAPALSQLVASYI